MGRYANRVIESKLFKQFDSLVFYEDVNKGDIAKLKQLVLDTADFVGPHLDRIRETFKQYTEHDLRHLCNVADLVYRFLPKQTSKKGSRANEKIRLNAVELAFLWLAILLHDIGMYVNDSEKQETLSSADYRNYLNHNQERIAAAQKAREQGQELKACTIDDALLAEYYRCLHAVRVRIYMRDKLQQAVPLVFHDVSLLDQIADLCESHAWGVRDSNDPHDPDKCVARMESNRRIRSFRVNLRYLACCLRLGDILDFDKSRTPLSVYDEIDFSEEDSIKEWNKHLSIDGWQVDEHCVLFDASCTHPAYYVAVHDFLNRVDQELRDCRYMLDEAPAGDEEKYPLHLAHAVDRRQVRMSDKRYVAGGFRFRLEYEEIMRLLMDKSLYPDSTLFLRELLQNALDACRYQEALAKESGMGDKYLPRIIVWDYSKDPVAPRIVFQDNGIGMSQSHVENFFLRVGKSFYRSPEFKAERQRLADHGIHLDACSQFGIGFLSCFLGGDRIKVETWRYGNAPLKITISGPSKYFLIERLPEPTGYVKYKSPDNELEDGPFKYSGTRVTVHLKERWHTFVEVPEKGIVYETLDTFAVNQEYDIQIYVGNAINPIEIARRRWNYAEPLFCNELNEETSIIFSCLVPSVFNLHEYSNELLGQGAIWMLKGPDGKPCPACGDLTLSGFSISVDSIDLLLFDSICEFIKEFNANDRQHLLNAIVNNLIKESPDLNQFLKDNEIIDDTELTRKIEDFATENEDEFVELSNNERKQLADLCISISSAEKDIYINWYQKYEFIEALANGNRDSLLDCMRKYGIPRMTGSISLTNKCLIGIFGINVPGGITIWEPLKGSAKQISMVPKSVAVYLDTYGSLAPQPSVSRLFVHEEQSGQLRLELGRAILRHATRLIKESQDVPAWQDWYEDFLYNCEPLADAVKEEFVTIQEHFKIECKIQGKSTSLTPRQLCEIFGDSALMIRESATGVADGIVSQMVSYILGNKRIIYLPMRKMDDGTIVFDLTTLREKLGM